MPDLTSPNKCLLRADCGVWDRPGTAYDADPLTSQPAAAPQQTDDDRSQEPVAGGGVPDSRDARLDDPGALPATVGGHQLIGGRGPPAPWRVRVDRRRSIKKRLHDPPALLYDILIAEPTGLADDGCV